MSREILAKDVSPGSRIQIPKLDGTVGEGPRWTVDLVNPVDFRGQPHLYVVAHAESGDEVFVMGNTPVIEITDWYSGDFDTAS